jgi:ribosomal protein S18 acetylase RimI-like enzyme
VSLRRATLADAPEAARLIAEAFDQIPITRWLVPFTVERRRIMPRYFQVFVEHAAVHGTVDVTDDLSAVAVWLPAGASQPPPIGNLDRRMAEVCGAHLDRFEALHKAMDLAHPSTPAHDHLLFLAVAPDRQRQRLGTALLRHHERLDAQRRPAYLEASSAESARLYRRHWYTPLDAPFTPRADCDGLMFPMWRSPERSRPDRGRS